MKIICVLIAALMCLSSTVVLADASQATGTAADTELDATWKLGKEAYIYSFPLVLMSATEAKMTNVEEPDALHYKSCDAVGKCGLAQCGHPQCGHYLFADMA